MLHHSVSFSRSARKSSSGGGALPTALLAFSLLATWCARAGTAMAQEPSQRQSPAIPTVAAGARQDGGVPAYKKRQPLVPLPGPLSPRLTPADRAENIALLDQLLARIEPGQETLKIDDMLFDVRQLRAWRQGLAKEAAGETYDPVTSPWGAERKSPPAAHKGWPGGEATILSTGNSNAWSTRWNFGEVFYEFDPAVTTENREQFLRACIYWQNVAGVEFIPRSGQTDYIYVRNGTGNQSWVGRKGGRQDLDMVSWWSLGIIAHEIGHALGFQHEHQRKDRDQFIDIDWANIKDNMEYNFALLPSNSITFTGYDFYSVMHYERYITDPAFVFNGSIPSITAKTAYAWANTATLIYPPNPPVVGQRMLLSWGDAAGALQLYGWPQMALYWNQGNMSHGIGRADNDGWSANVAQDGPGFLAYGPYTRHVAPGSQTALFELMVDTINANNDMVARIEAYDVASNTVLQYRDLYRWEFLANYYYQPFELHFYLDEGRDDRDIEFRIWWTDTSYVRARNIGITQTKWKAASEMSHNVGRADGDGWSANVAQDSFGHMTFGPYTPLLSTGLFHDAAFELMIDNSTANNEPVATIDAFDATTGTVLGTRTIYRQEFREPWKYQTFLLGFSVDTFRAGHLMEFRVLWHDTAYIRQKSVSLL